MGNDGVPAGSVIRVQNMLTVGGWLALVVDQAAGEKWLERNPSCVEFNEIGSGTLVRVLGQRFVEGVKTTSLLPKDEPDETEIVHWARLYPGAAFEVHAGPGTKPIEVFLENMLETAAILNLRLIPWHHDLKLVAEYLRGVTRKKEETSSYERKYFMMLSEVLPKQ